MKRTYKYLFTAFFLMMASATSFASVAPDKVIDQTAKEMFAAIDKKRGSIKNDISAVYDVVEKTVLPNFDFRAMSQFVLGRYWKKASKEEQNEFAVAFQTMLVRTYASQVLDYNYSQLEIKSTAESKDGKKAKVRTVVNREGADAVPITYSLRSRNGKWMVYDVEIEGISLVTNYRSAFADEAKKNGVGALAKKLANKNAEELGK